MSVLVDSSVWIDYFRNGTSDLLDKLIIEDLVITNDLILSELIPALKLQDKSQLVESLESLETIPLNIDWNIIRRYQFINLKNGINKVGIPDLIILQQVIEKKIALYSFDKHFTLMQEHFHFELITSS